MDLQTGEAIQFQNELIMALLGVLDRQGILLRDDAADYFQAIAEESEGNRSGFFEMMAATCSKPKTRKPHLRIVD